MREYDLIAAWYEEARNPEIGVPEVEALVGRLPPRARVLDLGCGHGEPLTALLVGAGCRVVGVDSSAEMIERFRARFPDVDARCERIEEARFEPGSFDAVLAWGVLFHLSAEDQLSCIEGVERWLAPGGEFVFTSGEERGIRTGEMQGVPFRYTSLGTDGYREGLQWAGLQFDGAHEDAWGNVVFRATKRPDLVE